MRGELIDLHAHVLPGVDDGPTTAEEALRLLSALAAQGIGTVVAGAHTMDGRYNATREAVLTATEQLNRSAVAAGLAINVLPGMEAFLGFDLLAGVKAGKVLGLNESRHLLVELPYREFPLYAERAFFELLIAGYRPVLNHPERNRGIQKNPDLVYRLADQGIGIMVTAASLTGRMGAEAQHLARRLVSDLPDVLIVSDAHDLAGRAPCLAEALTLARELGKRDQLAEAALLA